MVTARELRIGNWLICDKMLNYRYCYVDRIKSNGFSVRIKETNQLIHYADSCTKPIPLTPEILEQCGFENEKLGDLGTSDYIKGVIIVGRVAGTYEWQIAIYKRFIKVFIQHLHQLQNLMYMLTGEELTINIPQLT
jgi:hypothetical protein